MSCNRLNLVRILVVRKSECFEHDIEVRKAWVSVLTDEQRDIIISMESVKRFELYLDIDAMVKERYLDDLIALNADQEVIHIKGLGPVRQAKTQITVEERLLDAAHAVMDEFEFPKEETPVVEVSETDEDQ